MTGWGVGCMQWLGVPTKAPASSIMPTRCIIELFHLAPDSTEGQLPAENNKDLSLRIDELKDFSSWVIGEI